MQTYGTRSRYTWGNHSGRPGPWAVSDVSPRPLRPHIPVCARAHLCVCARARACVRAFVSVRACVIFSRPYRRRLQCLGQCTYISLLQCRGMPWVFPFLALGFIGACCLPMLHPCLSCQTQPRHPCALLHKKAIRVPEIHLSRSHGRRPRCPPLAFLLHLFCKMTVIADAAGARLRSLAHSATLLCLLPNAWRWTESVKARPAVSVLEPPAADRCPLDNGSVDLASQCPRRFQRHRRWR